MTQKDYEFIAKVLARLRPQPRQHRDPDSMDAAWDDMYDSGKKNMWRELVAEFDDELSRANPRFKHSLFMRACGVVSHDEMKGIMAILNEANSGG